MALIKKTLRPLVFFVATGIFGSASLLSIGVQPDCPECHANTVYAIKVLDKHRLATASSDGTVKIWSRSSGKHLFTFSPGGGPLLSMDFLNTTGQIFVAGDKRRVYVMDSKSGRVQKVLDPKLELKAGGQANYGQGSIKILRLYSDNNVKGIPNTILACTYYKCSSMSMSGRINFQLAFKAEQNLISVLPVSNTQAYLSVREQSETLDGVRLARLSLSNGKVVFLPTKQKRSGKWAEGSHPQKPIFVVGDGMLSAHAVLMKVSSDGFQPQQTNVLNGTSTAEVYGAYILGKTTGGYASDAALIVGLGWPPRLYRLNVKTFQSKWVVDMPDKVLSIAHANDASNRQSVYAGIKGGRVFEFNYENGKNIREFGRKTPIERQLKRERPFLIEKPGKNLTPEEDLKRMEGR